MSLMNDYQEVVDILESQQYSLNSKIHIDYRDENGKYHRNDTPAIIYVKEVINTSYCNGCDDARCSCDDPYTEVIIEYYQHGLLHREGGPARYHLKIYEYDYYYSRQWYQHGLEHNEDGPSTINNKYKVWRTQGKFIKQEKCR